MIFTDYWKVPVHNFSEILNTVFFSIKKLTESWYLLITENSCSELFRDLKYGLFEPKCWWKDDIYLGVFKLSKIFQDLGNIVLRAVIMISKAMQGGDISLIGFNKLLQEIEKYRKLKAEKRSQDKNYVRQITKM